eukprot:scpid102468/ scgid32649/ 
MLNLFRILVAIWELLMLATSQGQEMWNGELMKLYHDYLLPAWAFDFADDKTVSDVYVVISIPIGYNADRNAAEEAAVLLSTTVDAPAPAFDLDACLETSKPRLSGAMAVKPNTTYFQVQKIDKDTICKLCTKMVNSKGMPNVMLR